MLLHDAVHSKDYAGYMAYNISTHQATQGLCGASSAFISTPERYILATQA